ncbi:MAG TPA: hypothetical protein PKL26_03145, partial [Methanolinea sp.]|nr:hypothetical protein [Methanolinea sp.]
ETPDNSGDNPQRKGKERKGKESIAAPVITPEETEEKEGPFELPSKEDIVESSPSWIRDKIDEVCKRLVRENIYPEAVNYVLAKRNMRVSERALLHALCRVHISKPKHPKAFMDKIIAIENGNYNEYEHCQSS